MFRIRVNSFHVGLVFRNGAYSFCLTEGVYWLLPNERVIRYDCTKAFTTGTSFSILLEDQKLNDLLHFVEVADKEIVLVFKNNNFNGVLTPGQYAFWKAPVDWNFKTVDLSNIEIDPTISKSLINNKALHPYVRIFDIEPYEKAILMVDNELEQELKPGMHYFWKNATPLEVLKADTRQQQLEMLGQEILTNDKASLRVNFYAQYKIIDAQKALFANKQYEKQLYLLLQLALRAFIGMRTLDDILGRKEDLADLVKEEVASKATDLGVELIYCGIRDIILPGDVKAILNQVLIAQKQAQANVITRREETASTRSLLNTAKLMEENDMLFKLKEMEYIEKIADKINAISLAGGNQVLEQLKGIFTPTK